MWYNSETVKNSIKTIIIMFVALSVFSGIFVGWYFCIQFLQVWMSGNIDKIEKLAMFFFRLAEMVWVLPLAMVVFSFILVSVILIISGLSADRAKKRAVSEFPGIWAELRGILKSKGKVPGGEKQLKRLGDWYLKYFDHVKEDLGKYIRERGKDPDTIIDKIQLNLFAAYEGKGATIYQLAYDEEAVVTDYCAGMMYKK